MSAWRASRPACAHCGRSGRGYRGCSHSPSTRRSITGAETGALSTRAGRLLELPRGGPPPEFGSAEEWEAEIAASGKDYTRSWWDARPHPRLGTLEVRIPDQPTSVDRTAALAALARPCARRRRLPTPVDRDAYLELRAAAARGHPRRREPVACWSSPRRGSSAPGSSSRSCASRRRRSGSSRSGVVMGSRPSWPTSWSGPRHDPAPRGALPAPAGPGAAGQLECAGRPRRPRDRGRGVGRRRRPSWSRRRPGSRRRAGGRADPGRLEVGAGGLVRHSRARATSRSPSSSAGRAPRSSTWSPPTRAPSSSSAKARSAARLPGSAASRGSGRR